MSEFKGKALDLFVWNIILSIASGFFLVPLAFVLPKYLKWFFSQIMIDDSQLEFIEDGPAWEILIWILFATVTFGIGAPFAYKKMLKWVYNRVRVVGENDGLCDFTGTAWDLLANALIFALGWMFFIIPAAWTFIIFYKYMHSSTVINGRSLIFDTEAPWFGVIGWIFFGVITLGIGSWYAQKKIYQYIYQNTHFSVDYYVSEEELVI
ncbi:hypothetical protein [Acholeplasma hippikon]|uniref:Uncharacterized protein n=1 Tax=Acholeplasma hippikon TaxID=264636 RepID=A0A449BKY1_9MOLU|nr:hypothetical protein [Acholeplasma hippikon]VEU83109.1 Uncharacterised protein [Acholeplasma hippikon]